MIPLLRHFVGWLAGALRSRPDLILENPALRQQLLALHEKRPRRRLGSRDRVFWVALRKLWSGWKRSLFIVTPETVMRWHRTGFRRTLNSYFDYYHRSRTHLSLGKDAPEPRSVHPQEMGRIVAVPQVGGLHHR